MGVLDRGTFTADFGRTGVVVDGAARCAANIGGDPRRRRAGFKSGRRIRGAVGGWADQRRRDQGPLRVADGRGRYPGRHGGWIGEVLLGRRRYSGSKRGWRIMV